MWASNKNGTEALLAVPLTLPAKLVVFFPAARIKKERPFSLEIFRHTGDRGHLLSPGVFMRSMETYKASFYCMLSGRFWAFPLDRSGFSMTEVYSPIRFPKPWIVAPGYQKSTVLLRCFSLTYEE